jgi:CRP-like cAMP-binding protein
VPFFENFDKELVSMIADKLEYKLYKENDISMFPKISLNNIPIVIAKGDEGDCMYVLYQGEVNVIAGDEDKVTTTLGDN